MFLKVIDRCLCTGSRLVCQENTAGCNNTERKNKKKNNARRASAMKYSIIKRNSIWFKKRKVVPQTKTNEMALAHILFKHNLLLRQACYKKNKKENYVNTKTHYHIKRQLWKR